MKKIKIQLLCMAALLMAFMSCTPDNPGLGSVDISPDELKEGTAFVIEPDASNPNLIHFKSLLDPKYHPLWTHSQGRSQGQDYQVMYPFPGTYNLQMGVVTRGGVVYSNTPVTFDVETFYPEAVSDELWTLLAGGIDNEKTWYLDLDANGTCRYFGGPLTYYGTDDWWGNINKETPPLGDDSWSWGPDWADWVMPAGDYGSMTFNLKGNANIIVDHKMIPSRGKETGTFMIDTKAKTLKLIDAGILHDAAKETFAIGEWKECRILSLTEDAMQLAVQRDPVTSGEGPCQLSYNFISKEYFDRWNAEH